MKVPLFYPEFDPGLNIQPTLWPQYTGLSTGGCLLRLESLWPECNKLAGLCSCMFVELLCLPMERESGRPARCVWVQGPSWSPMGWFIIRAALVDPQEHVGRKMRRMTLDGWEPAERMQKGTCGTGMGMNGEEIHTHTHTKLFRWERIYCDHWAGFFPPFSSYEFSFFPSFLDWCASNILCCCLVSGVSWLSSQLCAIVWQMSEIFKKHICIVDKNHQKYFERGMKWNEFIGVSFAS